jgi:bifunctional non-homologous end joining protein LigD
VAASSDDEAVADSLSTYRAKRSADRSPEPVGRVSTVPGRLFVVHKHAATHLHYDLRLEMAGVLKSWAVPRGPSYDMADKRLAVHVEDHPIEYGDFEGRIPDGNYGAGGMIVWDRGEWVPLEDWREGLEKGKLLFELRGIKLHGKWTLVKIKKSEKDWLLIKERDGYVKSPGDQFIETSVLSGLTVDEVKEGRSPASALRDTIEKAGAVHTRVDPRAVEVMLAEPRKEAFTQDGWLFELKLDGYRLIASKSGGEALLLTRNGNDYTAVFPEIARAIKALPYDEIIIDGEVVVHDAAGKPSFARLQRRGRLTSSLDVARAAVELPATFYAFDFIAYDDLDLRPLALSARKALLKDALPKLGVVRALDHIEREGVAFMNQVVAMELEGIIAKRADVPYRGGRSDCWFKIKADRTADFVIVGFTEPRGSRSHLGALQLADYVNGKLTYAGRVGTGFDDALLADLFAKLEPTICKTPACGPPIGAESIPEIRTTTWVEPRYVVEVRYREWTPDHVLRHATFMRLREDKPANACDRQGYAEERNGDGASAEAAVPPTETVEEVRSVRNETAAPAREFQISNRNKVYWPADRYTKGDLIDYYTAIWPWMSPYLRNRPLVMTRFPDGIDGKSFYQKDAPEFAPAWIRTFPIWSEDTQRDVNYFVCDDIESLRYVANLGSIPMHIWNSRIGSLEQPDWCVIDLDPKDAPFSDVVRSATAFRKLCESIGMPSYVKTTGKTGLHILLPLGRQCTYEQCRTLGELLARVVLRELGSIATIMRHVTKRGDKVYFDYLQNRYGQLIVSPFSVRPLPGATVSMPLLWDEVDASLDPRNYTIRNAIERMERLGHDPVARVLEDRPDLAGILDRLMKVAQG